MFANSLLMRLISASLLLPESKIHDYNRKVLINLLIRGKKRVLRTVSYVGNKNS